MIELREALKGCGKNWALALAVSSSVTLIVLVIYTGVQFGFWWNVRLDRDRASAVTPHVLVSLVLALVAGATTTLATYKTSD